MNQNDYNNINDLDCLIEGYFEGLLDVREEKRLADMLLTIPLQDLSCDAREALALLSLAAVSRSKNDALRKRTHRSWIRIASVAVVALIAVAAAGVFLTGNSDSSAYAYVNGQLVTDKNDIRHLMQSQLDDVASARSEMMASVQLDLSEFSSYIDDDSDE